MLITVKTLSGRKLAFEMETNQTVKDIKDKLFEKEQIPANQIRLIYLGRNVTDESTIEDIKFQSNTELMMAINVRGGMK